METVVKVDPDSVINVLM